MCFQNIKAHTHTLFFKVKFPSCCFKADSIESTHDYLTSLKYFSAGIWQRKRSIILNTSLKCWVWSFQLKKTQMFVLSNLFSWSRHWLFHKEMWVIFFTPGYVWKSLNHVNSLQPYGLWPTRLLCPWIFQARILEWFAISFSRGSSWPRDQTHVSCIAGRFFTTWAIREAHPMVEYSNNFTNNRRFFTNSRTSSMCAQFTGRNNFWYLQFFRFLR